MRTKTVLWVVAITVAVTCRGQETPAQRAEQYIKLADRKLLAHDYAGAIANYTSAITADPQNPYAWSDRGIAREDSGDLAGALEDYTQAILLKPDHGVAYSNRGHVRNVQADFAGAVSDETRAIEIMPRDAESYAIRGAAKRGLHDFPGAISDFDASIRLGTPGSAIYVNRGGAKSRVGDYEGAIADFKKALQVDPGDTLAEVFWASAEERRGDLGAAEAILDKILVAHPRDLSALVDRGTLRERRGDLEGATADLSRAIRLQPNNADYYSLRAITRSLRGDVAGGLEDFSKAVDLEPDSPERLMHLAQQELRYTNYEAAISHFSRILVLKPSAQAYAGRGRAKAGSNDVAGGLRDLDRSVELEPANPHLYNERGQVKENAGDATGAMADYEKAIEVAPNFGPSYGFRGKLRGKIGDEKGQEADYTRWLELLPDQRKQEILYRQGVNLTNFIKTTGVNPLAYDYDAKTTNRAQIFLIRAEVRAARDDVAGARADLAKAIELRPDYGEAYGALASLEAQRGNFKAAITNADRLVDLKPEFASYLLRGNIRKSLGDIDGARTDFSRAAWFSADPANNFGALLASPPARQPVPPDLKRRRDADSLDARPGDGVPLQDGQTLPAPPGPEKAAGAAEPETAKSARRYHSLGLESKAAGDIHAALKNYSKAIELNPGYAEAYCSRGVVEAAQGDQEAALRDFNRAIELRGDYAFAWNDRANLKAAEHDLSGAMADYDRAADLAPAEAAVYFNRALLKKEAREIKGAIKDLDAAIKLQPDDIDALKERGHLREKDGDGKGATEDYGRVADLKGKREKLTYAMAGNERRTLRRDLDVLPGAVAYVRADAAKPETGDGTGTEAEYDKSVEFTFNDPAAYFKRGKAALQSRQIKDSIDDFTKAIALAPTNAVYYLHRGSARYLKSDFDGALDDLTKSISLSPSVEAYYSRGLIKAERRDFAGAVIDFSETIRLGPSYTNAYAARGLIRIHSGDLSGAESDLNKAIELGPNHASYYLIRSDLRCFQRDWTASLLDADAALRLEPSASAYQARGRACFGKGEDDEAYNAFTKAIDLNPYAYVAYRGKGLVNLRHGRRELALADFNRAVRLDHRGSGLFSRGCCYYEMGDWTNAIADFRLAMKENGVYPFAAIRIWMSRVRMGERQPATAELKEALDAPGANITNTWPRHIIKYLAGMETEPDFLNQAASPVPRKDAEQHCEAFFYIGWMRQLTGDKAAAREYFQKAIATQVTDYVEFRDAVHELQLMQ